VLYQLSYFRIAGAKVGFIFEFAIAGGIFFEKITFLFFSPVEYQQGEER